MANVVEILITGRDQFSGPAQRVRLEAKGLGGAMGGLGKTVLGVAGGFIAAQASMVGVQKIFSSTIGAAMAYEHQLAVIRALTGATKEDTDTLKVSIREMQKTLPKSAAELGAGAYFILSSGIKDVATATKVLELSAKASTIGLGETGVVASVLTSIMNAYQLKAKDAAKATDTLVNIVKFGKGEPTEFAQSLGRVIPIAAQMGIEFEQVGAVLATLTNTGLDVAESVTALRGIMVQILKPTDEAREKFAELGFDVVAFRRELDENFIGAMASLSRTVGEDEEAWATLFPEVRGMIGVMAAFSNQLPQTEENLAGITGGVGALDQGFKEVSDTTEFKTQKAMNDLNVQLQELGADVLPAVVVGLQVFKGAIEATFNPLDTWVIPVVNDLSGALGNLAGRGKNWQQEVAGIKVSTGETTREIAGMNRRVGEMEAALASAGDEVSTLDPVLGGLTKKITDIGAEADATRTKLFDMFKEPTKEEIVATAALSTLNLEVSKLTDQMGPATAAAKEHADKLKEQGIEASVAEGLSRGLTRAQAEQFAKLKDDLIPEQEDHLDVLRAQRDALSATTEANYTTAASYGDLAGKTAEATGTIDDLKAKQQAVQTEMDNYRRVISGTGAAFQGIVDRGPKVTGSIDSIFRSAQIAKSGFDGNVRSVDTLLRHLREIPTTMSTSWNIKALVSVRGFDITQEQKALLAGVVQSQHGFHGDVSRPTLFLAGEAGRERVDVTPAGQSGNGGGGTYIFNFTGPILGDQHQANQLVQWILPSLRGALR